MPASLQDIATLWSTLSKLGPTKKHLFRAGREVLLAVDSILQIAEDYLGTVPLSSDKKTVTDFFLSTCQRVVKGLAAPLEGGSQDASEDESKGESNFIHNRVLESIIGVLNEELGRLATATKTSPADRVKLQALTSIRETLARQRTRLDANKEAGETPDVPMRKKRGNHATRSRFEKNAHR